jgi:hypothetical protein
LQISRSSQGIVISGGDRRHKFIFTNTQAMAKIYARNLYDLNSFRLPHQKVADLRRRSPYDHAPTALRTRE